MEVLQHTERPGPGIPNPKSHPQWSHDPQMTTKIWLAPFQRNGSNDSMESSNDGIPTLQDLLKTRPKTACVMESSSENITHSNHEILVNLLNVLETRRLRKSAYSPRSQSVCSTGETSNDIEALHSLYKIYMSESVKRKKQPSIIQFQQMENQSRPATAHPCDCACDKNVEHKETVKHTRSNHSPTSPRINSGHPKSARFKTLPLTKVEFIREDHIRNVAERRRKCKSASLGTIRPQEDLWDRFGLSPVKNTTEGKYDTVLQSLSDELTLALEDHAVQVLENGTLILDADDPYPLSHHHNHSHRPGDGYRSCSRTESRSITPRIVIERSDGSRQRFVQEESFPGEDSIDSVDSANRLNRKKTSNSRPSTPEEQDEILYQSNTLKERLLQSRCSESNSINSSDVIDNTTKEGRNSIYDTESNIDYEESLIFSDAEEDPFDEMEMETLSNTKWCGKRSQMNRPITARIRSKSAQNTNFSNSPIDVQTFDLHTQHQHQNSLHKHNNNNIHLIQHSIEQNKSSKSGDLESIKAKHSCNTKGLPNAINSENTAELKLQTPKTGFTQLDLKTLDKQDNEEPLFQRVNTINKNGHLSPTNVTSLQHFQKMNIHDTKSRLIDIDVQRENTTPKEKKEKSIIRAKSAHTITKATKSEETNARKKATSTGRPRSRSHLSIEERDSTVQRKSKSASSVRSPRSKSKGPKKLTKDEKDRKKERSADIKKLKQLEKAEEKRKEKNKLLEEKKEKLEERKKEFEDTQADLLRQEEEMKKTLNDQRALLAQERKQKRKDEAEKRRQEVEKRREEKRLMDLEMARKNAEIAAVEKEEKEKAEALKAELKRLEEEKRAKLLEEQRLEEERQRKREEEERLEQERLKELEKVELLKIEEERRKREQVLMAAEMKLRLLEEEQAKQRDKQLLEQQRIEKKKNTSSKESMKG
ncbi:calponin homology domain-containing protein DDB_G0272472-like isoform X1 [Clytia hemisphaerica]|uniref:Uncharacterized protein n=1 Tax=Clytia hemisphaerica TaxID=252671 RepID=A0A7M5XFA6_9CNID